jgi:hypothetical protein
MTLRPIDAANGAIHDVARLKTMSTDPCNIIAVSETTLNIIQNYSIDEVTFLSRYGVDFQGGDYEPVDEDSPDFDFVLDVMRRFRLEVNDLTCDLVQAINGLAGVISASTTADCACQIGSDVDTTDGEEGGSLPDPVNGVPYEESDPITDRKCLASNYIHQSIRDVVKELKLNRADSYVFAGLQFVLTLVTTVIGGLIAGPFGLLVGAVVGSSLGMALGLFTGSFSLTLLLTAIEADEQAAVCALFDATSAGQARTNYTTYLLDEGATSLEIEFVEFLLSNNLLNLLFFAWGDSEEVIENTPAEQDCSLCDTSIFVHEFDFETGDEQGWTDDAAESRPFGIFVGGVGWTSEWGVVGFGDERLYLRREFDERLITQVDFYYTVTANCGSGAETVGRTLLDPTEKSVDTRPYTGECPSSFIQTLDAGDFAADLIRTSAVGDALEDTHDLTITKIIVTGLGPDPF